MGTAYLKELSIRTLPFFLFAIALSGELVFAKDVELRFERRHYEADLASIDDGDTVIINEYRRSIFRFGRKVLKKQHRYEILRKLGSGNSTAVFSLKSYRLLALRVPLQFILTGRLRQMEKGYALLAERNVPLAHVLTGVPGMFMLVDRAEGPTAEEYLAHPENFTPTQHQQMRNALLEFAKASSDFSLIGDFDLSQLAYVQEWSQWLLRDWSHFHLLASRSSNSTIWEEFIKEDPIFMDLDSAARNERLRLGNKLCEEAIST